MDDDSILALYMFIVIILYIIMVSDIKVFVKSWRIRRTLCKCLKGKYNHLTYDTPEFVFQELKSNLLKDIIDCHKISLEDYGFIVECLSSTIYTDCIKSYNFFVAK